MTIYSDALAIRLMIEGYECLEKFNAFIPEGYAFDNSITSSELFKNNKKKFVKIKFVIKENIKYENNRKTCYLE